MLEYLKQVNYQYKTQKMTEKQQKHRISFDEVREKVNTLFNAIKQNPSKENYELFYLIACFSSGIFSPPRRAEFANIKIKNYEAQHDNYLSKKKIVFNKYKTAKRYGTQEYIIPAQVMPILRKNLLENEYIRLSISEKEWRKSDEQCRLHSYAAEDIWQRHICRCIAKHISLGEIQRCS